MCNRSHSRAIDRDDLPSHHSRIQLVEGSGRDCRVEMRSEEPVDLSHCRREAVPVRVLLRKEGLTR